MDELSIRRIIKVLFVSCVRTYHRRTCTHRYGVIHQYPNLFLQDNTDNILITVIKQLFTRLCGLPCLPRRRILSLSKPSLPSSDVIYIDCGISAHCQMSPLEYIDLDFLPLFMISILFLTSVIRIVF